MRLVVNLDHLRAYNREYAQGEFKLPKADGRMLGSIVEPAKGSKLISSSLDRTI